MSSDIKVNATIFRNKSDVELIDMHIDDLFKTELGTKVANIICSKTLTITQKQDLNRFIANSQFKYRVLSFWRTSMSLENEQYFESFVKKFGGILLANSNTEHQASVPSQ